MDCKDKPCNDERKKKHEPYDQYFRSFEQKTSLFFLIESQILKMIFGPTVSKYMLKNN